jgi:hypothetical protein
VGRGRGRGWRVELITWSPSEVESSSADDLAKLALSQGFLQYEVAARELVLLVNLGKSMLKTILVNSETIIETEKKTALKRS